MANCAHYEPTIDEILSEPAVKALMRADGVHPGRLRSKLMGFEAVLGRAETPPRHGASGPLLSGIRREDVAARAVWC